MSVVTTLLVTTSCMGEDVDIPSLKLYKVGGSLYDASLQRVDLADEWGGDRAPEITMWGGAFNNLDVWRAIKDIFSMDWPHPVDVQLFVNREHEFTFSVYDHTNFWDAPDPRYSEEQ